jgi:telomere length regulation protein
LSSLSVPPSLVPSERTAFPSELLPAPLHEKYITAGRRRGDVLPLIMDELSTKALSKERDAGEHHPELIRERRLRVQQPVRITEVAPHQPLNSFAQVSKLSLTRPSTGFIDVAAEYFIVPLINRFWAFLRDEQGREERTSFRAFPDRYRGAGTGMILNAVVLTQFLRTLGILVHASQNAPEWLAIIAPDALELAVAIGTRPIPHLEVNDGEFAEPSEEEEHKEASVLTSGLEVALIVLDGALEIDGGKILGLEHTTLVLAVGEWAGKVFASLEKGLKVPGGGGVHEAKLSRAAAGVLLKVDELSSKWRRSMLDTR